MNQAKQRPQSQGPPNRGPDNNQPQLQREATERAKRALEILMKKPLPIINTTEQLNKLFTDYPSAYFKILLNPGSTISPAVKVILNPVYLDDDVNLRSNRDLNQEYSGDIFPTGRLISSIRHAGGLKQISSKCVELKTDPATLQAIAITYEAIWEKLDFMGSPVTHKGDYRYSYNDDTQSHKTPEQIKKRRMYAQQNCQSGADNRAIMKCFGLNMAFSPEDIGKILIVPYVDWNLDFSDPEIKKLIFKKAFGSARDIYGPDAAVPKSFIPDTPAPATNTDDTADKEKPSEAPHEDPSSPESQRRKYELDWEAASIEDRAKEIITLATKAKVNMRQKGDPATWSQKKQMNWIMLLAESLQIIPAAPGKGDK